MSKYDDICAAFGQSRRDYNSFRDDCYAIGIQFYGRLIRNFEIPADRIHPWPLEGQPDVSRRYTVPGAMHLAEDGLWHLGIALLVYEGNNIHPRENVMMDISIKKQGDNFIVSIVGTRLSYTVSADSNFETIFDPFFDQILEEILREYEGGLQRFMEQSISTRRIGF